MMGYFQNMMFPMFSGFNGAFATWMAWWLFPLVVWNAAWKGVALWRAGRANHLGWFVALFLLNTAGILEIIYIVAFNKKKGGN